MVICKTAVFILNSALFQIQPLAHKMICQYKGGHAQHKSQEQAKAHINPEIGIPIKARIVVISKSKENVVYTHISIEADACQGSNYGAEQIGNHFVAHVDPDGRKDLMVVKAVSNGNAHIDDQCAGKEVHQCCNQKDGNPHARRHTKHIRKRTP